MKNKIGIGLLGLGVFLILPGLTLMFMSAIGVYHAEATQAMSAFISFCLGTGSIFGGLGLFEVFKDNG